MKKIILLLNVFALCLLVACNPNDYAKFNDKDAFVAFDGNSYSVSEQGGSIKVPVTLASVKGIQATVTVVGQDGTAKNGVNYRVKNGSLNFDAATRTAYAEIEIIDNPGVFTGNLSFTLTFGDLAGLNVGFKSSVTVSIKDEDHPLSALFGTYTVTGADYFSGGATVTWNASIAADDEDVSMVWISGLGNHAGLSGHNPFYGVVNADKTEIAVPIGQETGYSFTGGNAVVLFAFDGKYVYDSGNIIFKIAEDGTITCPGIGFGNSDVGYAGLYTKVSMSK